MSAPVDPVSARALTFERRGVRLLDTVDLDCRAGSYTVVLGPNGAGKSLLLRVLHGLLPPSGGSVRRLAPAREAMVFQRPALLRRSVLGNVRFALRMRRAEADRIALDRLERVGLAALADRPARVLSGGEQQRVALARAWALDPLLLHLDEPTASLDPAATRAVEAIVRRINATGTTILMATHDLAQARRLATHVILLHRGRIVEAADAATFFGKPATPEAAAYVQGELLA